MALVPDNDEYGDYFDTAEVDEHKPKKKKENE